MKQGYRDQWLQGLQHLRCWCRHYWLPLVLGVVGTIAVLGVWQQLSIEQEQQVQQLAPQQATAIATQVERIVQSNLVAVWVFVLAVALGQRSQRFAQRFKQSNQQLQGEILQRQQVEANLRASEERWQLAIQGTNDGVWDWNMQTNEVFYSSQWKGMLGFADHEITNHLDEWTKRIHPDDLGAVTTTVQAYLNHEQPFYTSEYRIQCQDGSYKWILDRGKAVWDEAGQPLRMAGAYTDMTERKQAEIALQTSEERYRDLINHLNAGFVVHAADTHILQCNTKACELLGLTIDQLLGKHAIDPAWHFCRDDGSIMPLTEFPVNQVLRNRQSLERYVVGIRHPSGRTTWVLVNAFPEWNDQGEISQVIVTFIEITDRKQAEIALAQEVMRNRTLFATSTDGIVILNHEGNVLQSSPRFAEMLGYSLDEMLTLNVADWDAVLTREELAVIMNRSDMPPLFETKHRRRDGSIYDVEISYNRAQLDDEWVHFCICRDITERKQAEIALQNSQSRLAGILEIADDAIISVDVNQKITLFNQGAERIFGYQAAEVLGQSLTVLLPDRYAHVHQQHVNYYAEHGKTRQMGQRGQLWGRRKDGSEFPAEASISKIDLNGELIFTTFLRDITERQQAEAAMAQLAAIVESSEDAVVSKNLEGIITSWNAGAERIFGYTAAAAIGQPISILIPEDHLTEEQQILEKLKQGEAIKSHDTVRRRQDGSLIDVSLSISPIKDINGQIIGIAKIARDIRDRKQAELQLKNLSDRLELAAKSAQIGIWDWDVLNNIIVWDDRMYALYGIQASEFAGAYEAWEAGVHPDDRDMANAAIQAALTGDQDFSPEFRVVWPDGTIRFIKAYSLLQRDSQGQPLRMIGVNFDITERKQAEVDLQRYTVEVEDLYNNAPCAYHSLDADGKFVRVNDTELRWLGYQREELLNQKFIDLVALEGKSIFYENFPKLKQQGWLSNVEFPIITKSGEIRWFNLMATAIKDEAGEFLMSRSSMFDISDRKQLEIEHQQAEAALRESEATKNAIIHAIPDLLIRMSKDGIYLDLMSNSDFNVFNANLMRDNATIYDILPLELAQRRMRYTQRAITAGITQLYEQEITIEGKVCYEEVRIAPLLQDQVLVMVRDITDRKQAEQEFTKQKEMFQSIVNNIPVMIALFSQDGQIEFINPELERTLGWSLTDWQERNIWVECYPDPSYRQMVLNTMLSPTGKWLEFKTQTATKIQLETTWVNIPLSDGHYLGIGQDITDRKHKEIALQQAMEAAEAANIAKSMFLANMSHELRTPLNVILGFLQVMMHDSLLTPAQRSDLQTIQRSGDHLLSLINDVLDLSKIEAGHYTLEVTGFDLISLLHTLRTMMAERAKAKKIEIEFAIAPEVPQFVITDEKKLRQVLLNLLSNAVKFTQVGGVTLQVTVCNDLTTLDPEKAALCHYPLMPLADCSPLTLKLEVTDTGSGIASQEIGMIFDAFVQAEAGRKSSSGTGLGLAISYKLLELMGGTITVSSTLGAGSTFTVFLPVYPTSGVDRDVSQKKRTVMGLAPGQPHRRILVVDDQQENRLLIVRLLSQLGLEVQEAANGQEAVQLWQNWHPDLIWMDIRMPILDGYEATRQIRSLEPEPSSIIIALTAQASQSDRDLALAAGCNDYISKPFQEATLFLKMAEYLKLEYLYAEAEVDESPEPLRVADPAALALAAGATSSHAFLADITRLPPDYLQQLEEAALCGADHQVLDLLSTLSSDYAPLVAHLTHLAKNFEFEQILNLIHGGEIP